MSGGVSSRPATASLVLLLLLSALACTQPSSSGEIDARDRPPNVLLIVTDDQREHGTLSAMPFTRRWFRRQGTRYANAFVTTPLCCPSRASILTGRYAHNHGLRSNLRPEALDPTTSIQHHLRASGYQTAIAGKYLTDWDLAQAPPGFDRWLVLNEGYRDARFGLDVGVHHLRGYSTRVISDTAITFLRSFEEADDRPWFLYVAPQAPHPPFTPARRYATAAVPPWRTSDVVPEREIDDKPVYLARKKVGDYVPNALRGPGHGLRKGRIVRRLQLRTLMSVDDSFRRITRRIRSLDEDRSTLVIFTSDNGYLWGEHGVIGKRLPYDPSIHVPLLVRWPPTVEKGEQTTDRFALNVDIAPTVLDVAGVAPEAQASMDGASLLSEGPRRIIFTEHWAANVGIPRWRSIRTRRYKYVEYLGEGNEIVSREYYDLVRDPNELTNLLGDRDGANDPPPSTIARLSDTIERYARCERDACP